MVNGTAHRLRLDHRTTLLDALREHLGPDRDQEGLRPTASAEPARCWSMAGG